MKKRMNILSKCLLVLAATIALTAVQTLAETTPAPAPAADQVIVTVNGKTLTQADIDADIQQKLAPVMGKMPADRMEQIKTKMQEKAVDEFITRTVLSQECEKHKISISDKETEDALNEMSKSLPEGMTLEQALMASGMDLAKMKSDISFGLQVNKLIESQVKDAKQPSEAELKEYYEKNQKKFDEPETVHARHILIKTAKEDDEKAKKEKREKLEKLRQEIVKGADFEKTARENSDCPSKTKGGDLGTFGRGRMVKEFEDAAFSQKVNEIGPVIETKFGFHVLQVLEHNEAKAKTYAEVKDEIKTRLEQKNKNKAVRDYIDALKNKATVVYGKK